MLFYITAFLIVGLFFLILEVFAPGGILGGIGVALMGISVYLCYTDYGLITGLTVLFCCSVVTLLFFVFAIKVLPNTGLGKHLLLSKSMTKEDGWHSESNIASELVGFEGVTESYLRPSGIAIINDERYDVLTEGGYVESHSRIRVIKVDGNRIVVERI